MTALRIRHLSTRRLKICNEVSQVTHKCVCLVYICYRFADDMRPSTWEMYLLLERISEIDLTRLNVSSCPFWFSMKLPVQYGKWSVVGCGDTIHADVHSVHGLFTVYSSLLLRPLSIFYSLQMPTHHLSQWHCHSLSQLTINMNMCNVLLW